MQTPALVMSKDQIILLCEEHKYDLKKVFEELNELGIEKGQEAAIFDQDEELKDILIKMVLKKKEEIEENKDAGRVSKDEPYAVWVGVEVDKEKPSIVWAERSVELQKIQWDKWLRKVTTVLSRVNLGDDLISDDAKQVTQRLIKLIDTLNDRDK